MTNKASGSHGLSATLALIAHATNGFTHGRVINFSVKNIFRSSLMSVLRDTFSISRDQQCNEDVRE
jgi:hypothetical protein